MVDSCGLRCTQLELDTPMSGMSYMPIIFHEILLISYATPPLSFLL
jgi:hypothetical protein